MRKCFLLSGPRRSVLPNYWLYNYLNKDYDVISYYTRVDDYENPSSLQIRWRIIKNIISVKMHACKDDLVVVYDNDTQGHYLGLLLALTFSDVIVHKINAMAVNKDKPFSPVKRLILKFAYRNIFTTVNNEEITNLFSSFLNVSKSHFIPIPDSISDFGFDIMSIYDKTENGYVFMGGATYRDYGLFIDVARELPQFKFVAVTFEKYCHFFDNAPSNIEVRYGLNEIDFYNVIAHSNIVFIPLTSDVQGGQMVVMQGALLTKPIITTNTIAIRTYFHDSNVYLVDIGDKSSSIYYIQKLMEDKNLRGCRGKKAYNDVSRFTTENIYKEYKKKLFNLITID